ncbi:hypothetical protein FSP39_022113 [Pinctada imbricata]|uniref:HTH psq-type domain-containing protein n=1 Tax=Pinctada imbricata TaxID=66713 RepID=A0AA88Y7J7_PINIB|nr:hypothetical protein FSP39_022113 [Pinctada imbricata]
MVDCGNSRCSQERRSFRKELLTWSKKIPIALGLERIAVELAGEESMKRLLYPFNCLETKEVKDWKQEQNCFFCESRLQLMFEAVSQLMEEAKSGKSVQDNPSLRYLQELLPYCPQFYTENVGKELLAELKSTAGPSITIETTVDSDAGSPQSQREPIHLKVPHIIAQTCKKKETFPTSCKKSYTEEELQAAVSEIQSGKLGTRRASVLYGIPRSTLRNKIFKMGSDKPESIYQSLNGGDRIDDPMEIAMKWSELLQGSNLALLSLPQLPFGFHGDYSFPRGMFMHGDESEERKLEYLRRKHNLGRKREPYQTQYSHELKLPVLQDIIQKLVEERMEMERNTSSLRHIKKEDKEKKSSILSGNGATVLSAHNIGNYALASDLASDIVIPSFRPIQNDEKSNESPQEYIYHSSLDKLENSRIGEALKDIIVKTISEKVRFKSQALADYCQNSLSSSHLTESDTNSKDSSSSHSNTPSPVKRMRIEDSPKKKGDQPVKKTRPKRGQYRRYNSQLLMEAVKAVQRGEMSVHRAGSYYGVPHSTLEYKVKERHLLRQKKIKEQREQKEAEQAAMAASSSNSSGSSTAGGNSGGKKTTKDQSSTSKGSSGKSDQKENTLKKQNPAQNWMAPFLPGNSNFDLGLYSSSGFALNTPASELLRKLQHKVQSKEDDFDQENSYSQLVKSGKVSALGDGFMFLN